MGGGGYEPQVHLAVVVAGGEDAAVRAEGCSRAVEGVAGHAGELAGAGGAGDVPELDRTVSVADGQGAASRDERERPDGSTGIGSQHVGASRACQRPEADKAAVITIGEQSAIGAECQRAGDVAARAGWGAERPRARRAAWRPQPDGCAGPRPAEAASLLGVAHR